MGTRRTIRVASWRRRIVYTFIISVVTYSEAQHDDKLELVLDQERIKVIPPPVGKGEFPSQPGLTKINGC